MKRKERVTTIPRVGLIRIDQNGVMAHSTNMSCRSITGFDRKLLLTGSPSRA
jgi:hypothetical protein